MHVFPQWHSSLQLLLSTNHTHTLSINPTPSTLPIIMNETCSRWVWSQLFRFPPGSVVTFSSAWLQRLAPAEVPRTALAVALGLALSDPSSSSPGAELWVGKEVVLECHSVLIGDMGLTVTDHHHHHRRQEDKETSRGIALFEVQDLQVQRSLRFVGVALWRDVMEPRNLAPNGYFIPRSAFVDLDVIGEKLFADSWARWCLPDVEPTVTNKRRKL